MRDGRKQQNNWGEKKECILGRGSLNGIFCGKLQKTDGGLLEISVVCNGIALEFSCLYCIELKLLSFSGRERFFPAVFWTNSVLGISLELLSVGMEGTPSSAMGEMQSYDGTAKAGREKVLPPLWSWAWEVKVRQGQSEPYLECNICH